MPESICLHIQDRESGPIRVVEIPWISVRIGEQPTARFGWPTLHWRRRHAGSSGAGEPGILSLSAPRGRSWSRTGRSRGLIHYLLTCPSALARFASPCDRTVLRIRTGRCTERSCPRSTDGRCPLTRCPCLCRPLRLFRIDRLLALSGTSSTNPVSPSHPGSSRLWSDRQVPAR